MIKYNKCKSIQKKEREREKIFRNKRIIISSNCYLFQVIIRANGINEILKIMTISMKDVRYCMIHMGLNISNIINIISL